MSHLAAVHDLGGRGPVLLLLHATGFHGSAYKPLAEAVKNSFHCIALDLAGHGDAPPLIDITPETIAADLLATITAHGWHGCFCFAHSGGGTVALVAEGMRCVSNLMTALTAAPACSPDLSCCNPFTLTHASIHDSVHA